MSDLIWWEIFIGGVATLAIYSFLFGENPLYRFFEHLYIGIATAITVMLTFKTYLWPKFFKPMLGFSVQSFPDGSPHVPYPTWMLLYLIPMAIGMLYYFILSKKWAWLAQIPIGISLGASGGLVFKGFFNQFIPQLTDSFRPLYVSGDFYTSLANCVFLTVFLSSLFYFFFTFKRQPGGFVERFSTTGRWMMMGCFGAFFGSTIMARMALLVERIQFFIDKWFPAVFGGGLA